MAVQDIFTRDVSLGGVFTADGATLSFDQMTAGLLAQSVQWQYQQNITRLYEIASSDVYLVAGRTQGQATVARVIGPTALAEAFYTTYGDVCNAATNTLEFSAEAGCPGDTNDTVTITLNNIVIQSYGGAVAAQDMVVNEQLSMLFLSLDYTVT
jgi:hypothetical protein